MNDQLKEELFEAFLFAINKVGFENFKKCSFFGSNKAPSSTG